MDEDQNIEKEEEDGRESEEKNEEMEGEESQNGKQAQTVTIYEIKNPSIHGDKEDEGVHEPDQRDEKQETTGEQQENLDKLTIVSQQTSKYKGDA